MLGIIDSVEFYRFSARQCHTASLSIPDMVPWDFSLENELHVTEEKVSDNTI